MPKVSWKIPKKRKKRKRNSTPPFPRYQQDRFWRDTSPALTDAQEETYGSLYIRQLTWAMAIETKLGPYEDPDEFVCRQDADTLVDSVQCADCPLNTTCFAVSEADLLDAERKLVD